MKNFLINNPFIFYTKDEKPHRAVFMETIENHSQEELKGALRISACNGIKETNLFVFSKIQTPADYSGLLPESSLSTQSAKELFSSLISLQSLFPSRFDTLPIPSGFLDLSPQKTGIIPINICLTVEFKKILQKNFPIVFMCITADDFRRKYGPEHDSL